MLPLLLFFVLVLFSVMYIGVLLVLLKANASVQKSFPYAQDWLHPNC